MRPKSYHDERCQTWAESPKSAVLCTVVKGYATGPCLDLLMQSFEEVAKESPAERVEAFHDWEGVSGYGAGTMERYTAWSKRHRDQVKRIHMLVASRMVAMAISVARLALPYLVGYSSRAEFEKARHTCIGYRPILWLEQRVRE